MTWSVAAPIVGAIPAKTPVVALALPCIRVNAIQFANPTVGSGNNYYLYKNFSAHPGLPGVDLKHWGKGPKITGPEWEYGRTKKNNFRACVTRDKSVSIKVKLVAIIAAPTDLTGTLEVTPYLDKSTAFLKIVTVSFTYPAGAAEHWLTVNLGGKMPNEIGRYIMKLKWKITGGGFRICGSARHQWSRLRIYGIYDKPLKPDFDSSAAGSSTAPSDGTLTGTRQRLDFMMAVIGGKNRRHKAATTAELVDLVWRLHVAVNNRNPPYFNASNGRKISKNYWGGGSKLDVADQWLGWARTTLKKKCINKSTGASRAVSNSTSCLSTEKSKYSWWNDMSCIGHAQMAKTMLAAVGFFARRVWVFPHTKQFPPAAVATVIQQTATPSDSDCYAVGNLDSTKMQIVMFKRSIYGILTIYYLATPKLMEPGQSWENFEACLLSPTSKFLPGGYNTRKTKFPSSFRTNKGFNSAKELLKWWSNSSRSGWGKRFLCWVSYYPNSNHVWDVDGNHYDLSDYVDIRTNGKSLPPPDPP